MLILDTLKKFTDIMDKRKETEFMKAAREFVLHGGSLILLAHVNKHADAEGRVVYSGTSDVVDDIDCAYTLEVIQETAFFENSLLRISRIRVMWPRKPFIGMTLPVSTLSSGVG